MAEARLPGSPERANGQRVDTAVCCSGGGIRSATYCLGALQALAADGKMRAVDLVTAVSGGSYLAAAWALQAAQPPEGQPPEGQPPEGQPPEGRARQVGHAAGTGQPVNRAAYRAAFQEAFKPGSPEESRLRDHTHYLIPNAVQGLRGVLSLLWGAVGNLLLVTSISYVVLALDGLLLRAAGGVHWTGRGGNLAPHLTITPLQLWLPAGLGIAAAVTFAASRSPFGQRPLRRADGTAGDRLMFWTTALLGLGTVAALLLVAGPALFAAALSMHWIVTGMGGQPSVGSVAATLSIYAIGLATLAKAAAGNVSAYWSRLGKGGEGFLRPWLARIGRVLLPWLGSAIIVAGLLAWGIYILGVSTHPGYQKWHIAVAAAIFLVLHVALDVNRTSMHDFYRDRLVNGYASRDMSAITLSQLRHAIPALTVCAAANLSSGTIRSSRPAATPRAGRSSALERGVPPGRGAVSWVFTPTSSGLYFPNLDSGDELAPTVAYEALLGADRMTLFDIVADSGAAVSPLMGKATSAAHRLLLATVNVRLGVWLPRPALVRLLQERVDADEADEGENCDRDGGDRGAGVAQQPSWATTLAGQDLPGSLTRWWLSRQLASWERVYRCRRALSHGGQVGLGATVGAALRWRIWQPNLFLLWREAAGRNPVGRKWIYVTDGGHYDNLGLVEALRQHPRHIYVLDASSDPEHSYRALGQAIALARSDLGVEIVIEPGQPERRAQPAGRPASAQADGDANGQGPDSGPVPAAGSMPGSRPAQVSRPFVTGTVTYPAATGAVRQGTISMIKLGVWAGADLPWDVRAYYQAHPTFPRASTLQQLYDDEDFEAYRELGAASMRALLAAGRRAHRHHRVRHATAPVVPGAVPGPAAPETAPAPGTTVLPG